PYNLCHSGLDPESSLLLWIPAFAGMTPMALPYEGTLQREKQIKEWKRQWKIELIERENPEWRDLYKDIL
ncbi:MAG: hypothetical protein U1D67_02885, partial [Dehalococcoidia bacterium]|nr:hypothetical protein [Dehalococcoidia bacterium]